MDDKPRPPTPPATPAPSSVPDKATLVLATLFAAFVAGAVLLLFVLPAEHGIDPTNFGRITGISRLHGDSAELDLGGAAGAVHHAEAQAPRNDTVTLTLAGLDETEYKLHLGANQSLLYSWTASGPVDFDFHGEPDEPSRPGEFASYEDGQDTGRDGSFQAPFGGRHGWYFRNVGDQPVTITLRTWGFYDVVGVV